MLGMGSLDEEILVMLQSSYVSFFDVFFVGVMVIEIFINLDIFVFFISYILFYFGILLINFYYGGFVRILSMFSVGLVNNFWLFNFRLS